MRGLQSAVSYNLSEFLLKNYSWGAGINVDSSEFDLLKDKTIAGVIIGAFVLIMLFGAIGNSLVVYTVCRTRKMWNATNIFIVNLAISDIFVCTFTLPLNMYYQVTDDWIFGRTLCHVIPATWAVTMFTSTLTLTMIAVDRYLLIVHSLKRRIPIKWAIVWIIVIIIVSSAVASPLSIYGEYIEYHDPMVKVHKRLCTERWPHPEIRNLYTAVTFVLHYISPLIIIAVLYTKIFSKVRKSNRQSRRQNKRNRTTKMLVAVVTIFSICWTPWHIYSLISEINYDIVKGPYYKVTDNILKIVALSSSCLNPILYGWLNDNYRSAFLRIVKKSSTRRNSLRFETSFSITKKSAISTKCDVLILLNKASMDNKSSDSRKSGYDNERSQINCV